MPSLPLSSSLQSFVLTALVVTVALSVTRSGVAQSVWTHFPFDSSVLTSSDGTGPNAISNGQPGPAIVTTNPSPKFGAGSAVNNEPTDAGNIIITYDRAASWSIAFWLYTANHINVTTIVMQPDDGGEFLFQLTMSQELQFQYDGGTVTNFNAYTIPRQTWAHFAVTGSTDTNTIIDEYVNGALVWSYSQTAQTSPGSTDYDALQFSGYYQDELWIFNSALTADQVTTLYKNNTA